MRRNASEKFEITRIFCSGCRHTERLFYASLTVSVDIGVPQFAYGYYDFAPYNCAPYGYYGPDWLVGGVFIGAGPGFTARVAFMATSTTVTILGMATPDHTPTAARSRSTISMQTRRGTDKAM